MRPVALVVPANIRRAGSVELIESGFALSAGRIARLDPLELLLPGAVYKEVERVLTFLQDALCSATDNHALPQFGSLTNYDFAQFGQVVGIDDIGSRA